MQEVLLGACVTAAFFVFMGMAYFAGEMRGAKIERQFWLDVKTVQEKPPDQTPETEADRQHRMKAESVRKGFLDMMSYDVTRAMKGDKPLG